MPSYRDGVMRHEGGDTAPQYLSKLYGVPSQGPSVTASLRTIGPEGLPAPYEPAANLTQADIDARYSHGAFDHFHTAWNQHGRNTVAMQHWERKELRDLERMAPYPNDGNVVLSRRRAASAPRTRPAPMVVPPGATLMDQVVTPTGVPVYTVEALVEADKDSGLPVVDTLAYPGWRVTRVQTYKVPPTALGFGESGARPFHQDYRHYKYYGFAGKGAKTSWAYNPKMSKSEAGAETPLAMASENAAAAAAMPLQEYIGGPNRPLTPVERHLVRQFRMHSYAAEGVSSSLGSEVRGGGPLPPSTPQAQAEAGRRLMSPASLHYPLPPAERIEPYIEKVDIIDRFPAEPRVYPSDKNDVARVATYRQPAPTGYTLTENPSPHSGSQSPFHQRYGHYKLHGFAGKGATSSWARNPKLALIYDHQ